MSAASRPDPMAAAEAALSRMFSEAHGFVPNLRAPKALSEKIQHRKLHERDPRMPRLADKVRVKAHVAGVLGSNWVVPTIWSGPTLPPRENRHWPIPYVLKANHGSGWNVFVRSAADEHWDSIESAVTEWLGCAYGQHSYEWLYSEIEPQLLVEPYLGPDPRAVPIDYRFLVFKGHAPYVVVNSRAEGGPNSIYDRDWISQAAIWGRPGDPQRVPRPHSFARMRAAAETLGDDFSFVRIDLYEVNHRPLFGEMTFYPCSGFRPFRPREFDRLLGDYWILPGASHE